MSKIKEFENIPDIDIEGEETLEEAVADCKALFGKYNKELFNGEVSLERCSEARLVLLTLAHRSHHNMEYSITLDIPFESLLRMRQEKAYEDLFTLRLPFIVDSVSYTSAVEAGLESGDEVVAIDDLRDADYPRYRDYLQKHKNDKVLLTVRRDGALIDSLALPVDAEGPML